MFWLKLISNFLSILRHGQTPAQVAGGFALGAILGLSPMLTLQGVLVWLIILMLDVNLSAATLAIFLFKLIAFIFDPMFHHFGYFLLVDAAVFHGLWTALYNAPIAPLTRFNNTVVIGSFVSALVFFTPLYFGMKRFVVAYRTTIGARVEQWRIYRIIANSSFVKWYKRIRTLGGVL